MLQCFPSLGVASSLRPVKSKAPALQKQKRSLKIHKADTSDFAMK
jgi:hypothetical protein